MMIPNVMSSVEEPKDKEVASALFVSPCHLKKLTKKCVSVPHGKMKKKEKQIWDGEYV